MRNKILLLSLFLLSTVCFARDPFSISNEKNQSIHSAPRISWLTLKHADATETASWLRKQKGMFSNEITFGTDSSGRKLWVFAKPELTKKALAVIQSIDKPKRQILVVARFVRVNSDREKNLGIKWHFNTKQPLRDLFHGVGNMVVAPGVVHYKVSKLKNDDALDVELKALESCGAGKIIAAPKLLLTEGATASIESGQKIPYQEKVNNDSTATHFEKAVLGLAVKAHGLPNQKIAMELTIHQDKPLPIVNDLAPVINTQVVKTNVVVPSGDVIVLGGVYEDVRHQSVEKIPLLGDIPIIGAIFSHKSIKQEHTELLVYIQPKLI